MKQQEETQEEVLEKQILKHVYKKNPYNSVNIYPFIKTSSYEIQTFQSALKALKGKKAIEQDYNLQVIITQANKENKDPIVFIDLTEIGRRDVENWQSRDELREVQDSVKTTNKIQRIVIKLTVAIAALQLSVAVVQLYVNCQNQGILKAQNQPKQDSSTPQIKELTIETIKTDTIIVHSSKSDSQNNTEQNQGR